MQVIQVGGSACQPGWIRTFKYLGGAKLHCVDCWGGSRILSLDLPHGRCQLRSHERRAQRRRGMCPFGRTSVYENSTSRQHATCLTLVLSEGNRVLEHHPHFAL
jgi:hypothetical protein